jgi:hypothetical protein
MLSDIGSISFLRFHCLGEFDDGKRSCRKRLADHNKRRRKPQPNASTSGGATAESIGIKSADDDPLGMLTNRDHDDDYRSLDLIWS